MIEVGVKELKSRLSFYLQLMQAGEEIAIKMRNRVVGFLSNLSRPRSEAKSRRRSKQDLHKMIKLWREEGFLLSGGPCRFHRFKAVHMTPGSTTTEIIHRAAGQSAL